MFNKDLTIDGLSEMNFSLFLRKVNQKYRAMTIPSTSPDARSETDPFLSLSLLWFRLTDGAYTDPVSLENSGYVHTVALWPGFLLMTGTKWKAIETSHGVPETLLDAFDRALKWDFKICYDQQSLLIEHLLSGYKKIAEITIFHEKARGRRFCSVI